MARTLGGIREHWRIAVSWFGLRRMSFEARSTQRGGSSVKIGATHM